MKIIIPTRGRLNAQQTLYGLPTQQLEQTIVVCPESERPSHQADANRLSGARPEIIAQPDENMTIAQKRKWIMELLHGRGVERCLMLDDDLFFYKRYWHATAMNGNGGWRLLDADHDTTNHWFDQLATRLSPDSPHGGFGPRQGNQNFPSGWLEGGRMMLALGYHVPTVVSKAEWGRIETREDMDISLQLLRQGLPNMITHEFCVGQKTYNAPGGCTGQRTTESSDADAFKLAELHPGLVRVVDKEYKGHPRKEVVVQWRKALEQGRAQSRAGA